MELKRFAKWVLGLGLMVTGFAAIGVKTEASEGTYYSSITNTTDGETLMSSLHSLISTGTTDVSYSGLWTAYKTTDVKSNGKIWDMYSNTDYTPGTDQAGNYSKEGDCYNREHTVPQSWFSEASPMKADLFHVYPTDAKVNGVRSNYLYGEVDTTQTIKYTSNNGCMLGQSKHTISGYSDYVFEPTDEYKGDFARGYFYMACRYSDKVGNWTSDAPCVFTGSYPYLTSYAIELFVKWSNEDPVSEKETARVDNVYSLQGNRNPFIDHPEWIQTIWGASYTGAYTDSSSSTDSAVTNVISLISALPSTITLDNETAVNAANTAYLALTTSQRSSVTNYSTLQAALATISSLKSSSSSGDSGSGDSGSTDSGSTSTDTTTATYTISSISAVTASGAPSGSSATYSSTYTSANQLTADKSMTLTLTGYAGKCITGIQLLMKSNTSKGSGYMTATAGTTTIASIGSSSSGIAFNNSAWYGSWSTEYVTITPTVTKYTVGSGETITIVIGATVNSLYCESISIIYKDAASSSGSDDSSSTADDLSFESQSTKSSLRFHYSTSLTSTGDGSYKLLTDASDIQVGSQFIIASTVSDTTYGMSTAKTSNYSAKTISVTNNVIDDIADLIIVTVEAGSSTSNYLLKTDSGYLGNPSASSSNNLKAGTTNYYWTINTNSDGTSSLQMQSSSTSDTRVNLKYNSTNNLFNCYASGQNSVSIYLKQDNVYETTYSDVKLQFGGCISKELYEALLKEGTSVSFGIELSLDGDTYTDYACTPVYVAAMGDSTEDASGKYVQYYAVIPVGESNYGKTVYAKCFVNIDGTKHFMNEAAYSINSLAAYYYSNATTLGLSDEQAAAVRGLVA